MSRSQFGPEQMEETLHASSRHSSRGDQGYSLIEILTTIAIMGTLLALGVGGFRNWAIAKDQEGAAADLQTVLRQTQTRAITEGVSFCVTFDVAASSYTVSRYACGTPLEKTNGPFEMNDERVTFTDISFRQPDGSFTTSLTFKPTGTATGGSVTVRREGSTKTYLVSVEGFTGRVSTLS